MGASVYICDDDAHIRSFIRFALTKVGIETETFSDGDDAWLEIQRNPPSVLITNQNRPGVTGLELVEKIRSEEQFSGISVILLTSRVLEIEEDRVRKELGIDVVLAKPINPPELIRLVRVLSGADLSE